MELAEIESVFGFATGYKHETVFLRLEWDIEHYMFLQRLHSHDNGEISFENAAL